MNADKFQIKNFSAELVNDTEYSVSYYGRVQFRVSMLNRTHEDPTLAVSYAGINGDWSVNYRWQFQWSAKKNGEKMVRTLISEHGFSPVPNADPDSLVEVIYYCGYWLKRAHMGKVRKSPPSTPKSRPVVDRKAGPFWKPVVESKDNDARKLLLESDPILFNEDWPVQADNNPNGNMRVLGEKFIAFLNKEYGTSVELRWTNGRGSSHCHMRGLGRNFRPEITITSSSANRVFHYGFIEYTRISRYILAGRNFDNVLGVLMILTHEYTHALDGYLNGDSIRGKWHTMRFARLEKALMRRHLGL